MLRQGGFTLVEIMVGMVVALLALLVIMQVFGSFEGQKRMTTGTADTQTSGALALQSVLREAQLAGFGMSAFDRRVRPMECLSAVNAGSDPRIYSMAPVEIIDGGAGASDILRVRYGTSMSGGAATRIGAIPGNYLSVDSNLGCQVGDTAIVSNGGNTCFIVSVEGLEPGVPTAVPPVLPKINLASPADASVSLDDLPTVEAFVSCLGQYREVMFAVNGDRLERDGEEVASGIVNMQVQYGISATPADTQIAQWVDSNGDWANLSDQGAADIDRRKRIKAVRVAIVARNPMRDREPVSEACAQPADLANPATGVCAWKNEPGSPAPVIDLSGTADWDHYRYRVLETIIPLRNVVWAKEAM